MTDLFLYGTLLHEPLRRAVGGDALPDPVSARLAGYRVVREPVHDLPALIAEAGAAAEGILLRGVPPAAMARIDAYEGDYRRRTITAETAAGRTRAVAYFAPDDPVTAAAPSSLATWSFEAWRAAQAEASVLVAEEVFAHDPPLAGESQAGQWTMMMMRAEARLRAGRGSRPARLRHAARPGDVTIRRRAPLTGDFFKLDRMEIAHRRFDGQLSGMLSREVLIGADAALVLPYDRARDMVLLIEQMRAGPARRGDVNPWTLEPVAGIVDPGETPEAAAHRETAEEAGLGRVTLRHMFSIYASPGSTTDHFHCYAGLCDLPEGHATRGGLDAEGEDLRLHRVPLDAALDLIATGEANAGPLVAMILWLVRARDQLEFVAGDP